MKNIFKISLVAVFATLTLSAQAQYRFGGAMMDHDGMMSHDMFILSQVNFGFGTARSMSMAGAFTSLGADLSAMGINPAGLGMYRSNDISFSPMISFNRSVNSAKNWGENDMTRFSPANLGVAFQIAENSSGSLVSATFAIGYNRVADLNYRYGYSSQGPYRSIADAFVRMMGQSGLFPDAEGALNYDFRDSYYWGGILGYNGYLLDVGEDNYGQFWTAADRIGVNAGVGHTVDMESKGSVGEFDISAGFNFNNMLYFGATIGIQSVNWKRQMFYGEDYLYNSQKPAYSDGVPLSEPVSWMNYNQAVTMRGAGLNAKLGLIFRPVEPLRLGVALHTPTIYNLERSYQAYMATSLHPQGDTTYELEDVGENSWDFCSPTRLMVGASYAFGRFALVSVDYERAWYNGIRVKNIPAGFDIMPDAYREEFKHNYKGSNTVRVGAEIKPLPVLALRAGYGFSDGALRNDKSDYYNSPQTYQTTCYSVGAGLALGRTTIDFAYQRLEQKQTEYLLYYALDDYGVFDTASPYYKTDFNRNYFTLTLSHRF